MGGRDLQRAAASIEKIRSLRVRPERDLTVGPVVGELHDKLARELKQTGGMGEAWRTVVPSELGARTRLRSFQRGVLTIEAPDAATRYLLEQWLRGGGRAMLAGCAPATVRRVVIR
ncbi:MAG TPA: DciA family protein [Phycisphaerales bacterium]|nr:DciA family protein [Phycisphaerales bacterium]